MKKEKLLTSILIGYLIIGLLFATGFAVYYKWPPLSFLSPGFFAVVFTWPGQIPGLIFDLQTFGLSGKPL